jgi:hypothetical protein
LKTICGVDKKVIKTKAFFLSIVYGCFVAIFCYCLTLIIGLAFNAVGTFFGWEHLVAILISCLIIFPGVGHLYVRHQPFSTKLIWLTSACIAIFGVIVSVLLGAFLMNWISRDAWQGMFFDPQVLLWIGSSLLLTFFFSRGALHFYFYFLKRSGILVSFTNKQS